MLRTLKINSNLGHVPNLFNSNEELLSPQYATYNQLNCIEELENELENSKEYE